MSDFFDEIDLKKEDSFNWRVSGMIGKAFGLGNAELMHLEHAMQEQLGEVGRLSPHWLCERINCPAVLLAVRDYALEKKSVFTSRPPKRLLAWWDEGLARWGSGCHFVGVCFRCEFYAGVTVFHNAKFVLDSRAELCVITYVRPGMSPLFMHSLKDFLDCLSKRWSPRKEEL